MERAQTRPVPEPEEANPSPMATNPEGQMPSPETAPQVLPESTNPQRHPESRPLEIAEADTEPYLGQGIEYRPIKPLQEWFDNKIIWVTEKLDFFGIDFFKLLGSKELKVEYFLPILQTQIDRQRITVEEANHFLRKIVEGQVNLLIQDIFIGTVIGWTSTKVVSIPLSILLTKWGLPEIGSTLLMLDLTTAIWETPYFAIRAFQEFRYYQSQLSEINVSTIDRIQKSSVRAVLLATVVFLNLLPQPVCWFPGLIMTFHRNKEFSKMLAQYNLDNIADGFKSLFRIKGPKFPWFFR